MNNTPSHLVFNEAFLKGFFRLYSNQVTQDNSASGVAYAMVNFPEQVDVDQHTITTIDEGSSACRFGSHLGQLFFASNKMNDSDLPNTERYGFTLVSHFQKTALGELKPNVAIQLWGDQAGDRFTIGGIKIQTDELSWGQRLILGIEQFLAHPGIIIPKRKEHYVNLHEQEDVKRAMLLISDCLSSIFDREVIIYDDQFSDIKNLSSEGVEQRFESEFAAYQVP